MVERRFKIGISLYLFFLISVIGSPLSIISMTSKEDLAKEFFFNCVNSLPISIVIYALIVEFIDEFPRIAS